MGFNLAFKGLIRKRDDDTQRENKQRWIVKLTGYKTRDKE
jgi:hypothetical protein